MTIAALLFGGGFAVGSLGIAMHFLPLFYTGFGAMCGMGLGFCYTPPI